jgi:hypothetical protein
MKSIPIVVLFLGILLLVASVAWGSLFPPTRTWNNDKSQQMAELASETNRLKFALVEAQLNPSVHSGRNPAEVKLEYDKVRQEYDLLHQEFESARDAPKTVAAALRWVGICLFVGGALFFYANRNTS